MYAFAQHIDIIRRHEKLTYPIQSQTLLWPQQQKNNNNNNNKTD